MIARSLAVLGLLLLAVTSAVGQDNPVLPGRVVKVTDGDTITVQLSSGPITVRLHAIDAPERDQPFGDRSTAALKTLVGGKTVQLAVFDQDRYERMVAVVFVDGIDANARMIRDGNAWAYREYLKDKAYCGAEHAARTRRAGLWALPAEQRVAPWEWRRLKRGQIERATDYSHETAANCIASIGKDAPVSARMRSPPAASSPSQLGCVIKGNISSNGRIYHMPGTGSYSATKIDTSKGERWFCSESEAKAAGWRPPRG